MPLAWLAARYCTDSLFPMGLAAPAGSLLSIAICLIAFRLMTRQLRTKEAL